MNSYERNPWSQMIVLGIMLGFMIYVAVFMDFGQFRHTWVGERVYEFLWLLNHREPQRSDIILILIIAFFLPMAVLFERVLGPWERSGKNIFRNPQALFEQRKFENKVWNFFNHYRRAKRLLKLRGATPEVDQAIQAMMAEDPDSPFLEELKATLEGESPKRFTDTGISAELKRLRKFRAIAGLEKETGKTLSKPRLPFIMIAVMVALLILGMIIIHIGPWG